MTMSSDWFGPQVSPPASHEPKPTIEISGPWLPSFLNSTLIASSLPCLQQLSPG
jgi:hypothetical protein